MIHVLDASAVADLLLRSDVGERVRAVMAEHTGELVSVAHLDAEVFSALARLHRAGTLEADEVAALLAHLGDLPVERIPVTATLMARAWEKRDNVAARDALYVVAAEALKARLVTTDERLARAVPDLVAPLG